MFVTFTIFSHWQARTESGKTGFIPENYINLDQVVNGAVDNNEMNVDHEVPDSAGYVRAQILK